MMRSLVGVVVVGSCVSCVAYPRPRKTPLPPVPLPAFAQRQVREIAVSPYAGNHQVGQCLAQAVAAWRDRTVAVVQIMNAQEPGAVLAWAAVNWAQADGPNAAMLHAGMEVLAGCLRSVENWVTPQIYVSLDAGAREVLACAAFTPLRELPNRPPTHTGCLRAPSGTAQLYVHVTAVAPDHQWIGERGLAVYRLQAKAPAAAPSPLGSAMTE